jgi:hypothetical protein
MGGEKFCFQVERKQKRLEKRVMIFGPMKEEPRYSFHFAIPDNIPTLKE